MSNVYLLSLEYKTPSSPIATSTGQINTAIAQAIHNVSQFEVGGDFKVRAGYMGICVGQKDEEFICSKNIRMLANMVRLDKKTVIDGNTTIEVMQDPLNLIMIAETFKEKIVFDGLIYIAILACFICFIILSTFPGWHEEIDDDGSEREVKPFPSRPLSHIVMYLSFLGAGFGFISVLWQHINSSSTVSMAETLTYGGVTGHVGALAMSLGWIAVGATGLVGIGLHVMILSIELIRVLTDDED
ncbi:hypothetical protein N7457_003382 [Penicillium paradoxum]|uniref:uncharacterized protein n=1 Tax=Penicillium paradoxum TaxID=176176 RepID=UPI002549360B|nr:uncharacterized protein N7457_003382 [Penicillium paradoxum]KAJ5788392.1 hypothetical protein N7457_003382 [Penicillium paradoxum]